MSFKITVTAVDMPKKPTEGTHTAPQAEAPRRSVVQVHFPSRNMTLAYYNDRFDLHRGDLVYVDGKLEGKPGHVMEVNYNFKINLSEYKRVIAVANTDVKGRFFMAGSHFVAFDPAVLPAEQVKNWFKAPEKEEDEIVSGSDDDFFCLDDLKEMNVSAAAAGRGRDYYMENRVKYLRVDNGYGYALVEGSKVYEVEFRYLDGEISGLTCSCFCGDACKHEFAVMLQLRETLDLIEKQYAEEYKRTDCFTAIHKGTLFAFAIDGKENGSFTL